MDILSNFSEFLSEVIIREETTMFELSKRIGIDDFVMNRWRTGKCLPTIDSLVVIADYFNYPIDYILGLSDSTTLKRIEPPKTFVDQLSSLMQAKNVTAYRLAKECTVGRAAVSKWLQGLRVPYIENLVAISEFFDCSVDFLIGRAA